jgi:hypothetical protein
MRHPREHAPAILGATDLLVWGDHTHALAGPGGLLECLLDMDTNAAAGFFRLRWP